VGVVVVIRFIYFFFLSMADPDEWNIGYSCDPECTHFPPSLLLLYHVAFSFKKEEIEKKGVNSLDGC
jgi:hypothetical protein